MLPLSALAALIVCASMASSTPGADPQTFELRGGRYWEPIKSPTTAPATDEILDRVGQLLENKNFGAAKKLALNWIKRNPKDHPLRDRGLYLLGVANFYEGERLESFYDFDELLDQYPDSKYFYPSLERQYEIADAYLLGYKRKFMGIPMFNAADEGIEILYRIQQRSPGSPLSEKSLKRTGDYYYAAAEYDLAVDAYQAFIERYPRSPDKPQIQLKKAFAQLAQFRGTRFDATPIINARAALEEIQVMYPEMARRENLSAVIERIDASLARKNVQLGEFYTRINQYKAAAYQYKYVLTTYPNSPESERARTNLTKLPASAQQVPLPPATQPAK